MIAKTCRDNLAILVRAYRAATGKSISAVSKAHYGNGGFLASFLAGQQTMSLEKYDTMVNSIRADWPEDARWPATRAIVLRRPPAPKKKSFPQVI